MKLYIFEGTPEEISKAMPMVSEMNTGLKEDIELEAPADAEEVFVTKHFARRVFTRRRLSDGLSSMFGALAEAYPGWVLITDLHEATGYSPSEFAGLMGAFGRRISHTNGYDEELAFIERDWDDEAGEWKYRLPDSVYEAYQELPS